MRIEGWVELGNRTITVSGIVSSANTPVQRSYPTSTVTVYLSGTLTLAAIFADDNNTAKANPFTSDSTGYYFFYAADGKYDIKVSGDGLPSPFTASNQLIYDPFEYLYPATAARSRSVSAKLNDIMSVKDFGAVGDGATDDTVAIQAAITWGIAHRVLITMPAGVYHTTDTLHIYGSASIHGGAGVGEGISIIRYAGTDTAIEIRNGSLNPDDFCYATELRDLTVQAAPGFHPAKGIAMYTLSEGNMDNVTIGGDATEGRFATGWYIYKGNIIEMCRVISSYNDIGFDFVGTFSQPAGIISISNMSSVFDADVAFRFNAGVSVIIESSFIESCNIALLYDGTGFSSGVQGMTNITLRNNHIAMNRSNGVDHKVVHVVSGSNISIIRGLHIENNFVILPNGFTGAYPFVFEMASALFNSVAFVTVTDNFINGYANEMSISDSGIVYIVFRDNFSTADGFSHTTNHTGPGVYMDAYCNNFGNDNYAPSSATLDIADKIGTTSVLIHEGPGQGFSSTLRGVDTTGATKWFFNKNGDLFNEGAFGFTHNVSTRWEIAKNGTETGSNAGSNFSVFRYSDVGAFLSAPFVILRDTSRFGFNTGSPVAGLHLTNPDATVPSAILDMASGQSTDALQIRTSSGVLKWKVDNLGNMTTGPTTTLSNTLLIASGVGTPEGSVTAPVGSIYLRTNGGANTSFYVKETGTGSTGWVGK